MFEACGQNRPKLGRAPLVVESRHQTAALFAKKGGKELTFEANSMDGEPALPKPDRGQTHV